MTTSKYIFIWTLMIIFVTFGEVNIIDILKKVTVYLGTKILQIKQL